VGTFFFILVLLFEGAAVYKLAFFFLFHSIYSAPSTPIILYFSLAFVTKGRRRSHACSMGLVCDQVFDLDGEEIFGLLACHSLLASVWLLAAMTAFTGAETGLSCTLVG
jgi:hypothetical protein